MFYKGKQEQSSDQLPTNQNQAPSQEGLHFNLVDDYQAMSLLAAAMIVDTIKSKLESQRSVTLIPSAGDTVEGLYRILAEDYVQAIDWSRVTVIQMDDYVSLLPTNPHSLAYFLYTKLISPLKISNYYFLNNNSDGQPYCLQSYQKIVDKHSIDIMIHGIGENAHLGFNEPGSDFNSTARVVPLTDSTIKAKSHFFNDEASQPVPKNGITLGLKTIASADVNFLLASGEKKRVAIRKTLYGKRSEQTPSSVLRNHKNTTIIVDQKAFSEPLEQAECHSSQEVVTLQ